MSCAECGRELMFDIRIGADRCVNEECEKWGRPQKDPPRDDAAEYERAQLMAMEDSQ
jgi:hypothetical protein